MVYPLAGVSSEAFVVLSVTFVACLVLLLMLYTFAFLNDKMINLIFLYIKNLKRNI